LGFSPEQQVACLELEERRSGSGAWTASRPADSGAKLRAHRGPPAGAGGRDHPVANSGSSGPERPVAEALADAGEGPPAPADGAGPPTRCRSSTTWGPHGSARWRPELAELRPLAAPATRRVDAPRPLLIAPSHLTWSRPGPAFEKRAGPWRMLRRSAAPEGIASKRDGKFFWLSKLLPLLALSPRLSLVLLLAAHWAASRAGLAGWAAVVSPCSGSVPCA